MKQRYLYFRLVLCFLVAFLPFQTLERRLFDFLVQFQTEPTVDIPISIIQLDRYASIDAHSRLLHQNSKLRDSLLRPSDYLIWDDLLFSTLLSRLKSANPKLVIVTYPFPATISEDRLTLTAEIVRDMRILWSSRLLPEGGVEYPPGLLTPYNNYGFSGFTSDTDGIFRRAHLFRDGQVSIELRALKELGQSIESINIENPQMFAPWTLIHKLPHIQLAQILFQPEETWEMFVRDRVIYLGVGAPLETKVLTPKGEFSSTELHAMVLANFMIPRGIIQETEAWVQILVSLVMIFMVLWITFRVSVTWAGALVVLIGLLLVVVTFGFLEMGSIWVPMASPLFTMAFTYSLLAHYQLIHQEEIQQQMAQTTESLRKVDEMKNNFMSLFSHDLKTPISKIDAICERMLKTSQGDPISPEFKKEFVAISEYNQELKNYIHNVLQLTRVESSRVHVNRTVCDLNMIILRTIDILKPIAQLKKIRLESQLEPIYTMELDESLVREILQNIIENAIHYSPDQSSIRITSDERDGNVVVCVEDEGPGIPQDEISKVTEKFYRGRRVKETTKGSGLGLYLVKYFTELHGGVLHIESEEKKGTKVEIRFPVAI